ncbi:MAG: N-acetyltransferase family protein [Bacteroidota bacterium]
MDIRELSYRPITASDWKEVSAIYEQGILTGNATFESGAPSWQQWSEDHLPHSRIIGLHQGEIVGWAALSPVSGRCVYGGVAEVSVYVSDAHTGKSIGSKLLAQLVIESEQNGIWTLQAGIFPENKGSIRVHEKAGFRTIGYREKIGKMKGVWRDIVLMERRSKNVGLQ